jgi:2-polyprenyl-6-methoxyphenol hydroxylase-like FAD-dependent oxidoreductase
MIEAYVLAGELHRAGGDIDRALARFEATLRSFVTAKQKSAVRMRGFFAPRSAIGLALRNLSVNAVAIPFIADRMIGTLQDDLVLPDYTAGA